MQWDDARNLLAVEVRNAERHEAAFWNVDLQKGKPLTQNVLWKETWWVGLEACAHGWMVVHGYADPGLPTHRGVACWDVQQARWVFEREELAYEHTAEAGIVLSEVRSGEKQFAILMPGRQPHVVTLPGNGSPLPSPRLGRHQAQTPTILPDASPAFAQITAQLKTITGDTAMQQIELLQPPHGSVVAYYTAAADGQWEHRLGIFSQGRLLYSDVLQSATLLLNPEPFVLLGNQLVYVKEKTQLVIVNFLQHH